MEGGTEFDLKALDLDCSNSAAFVGKSSEPPANKRLDNFWFARLIDLIYL